MLRSLIGGPGSDSGWVKGNTLESIHNPACRDKSISVQCGWNLLSDMVHWHTYECVPRLPTFTHIHVHPLPGWQTPPGRNITWCESTIWWEPPIQPRIHPSTHPSIHWPINPFTCPLINPFNFEIADHGSYPYPDREQESWWLDT